MNLQKLFEIQEGLDNLITKEHPVKEGEDRLAKKILALMVELGELCQEWRGFKFWSNDQEPRIGGECSCDDGYIDVYMGHGVVEQDICPRCEGMGELPNTLLEEYVDCLHFILSIGNDINMNEVYEDYEPKPLYFGDGDILGQFIAIYDWINSLYFHRHEDVNGEMYDLVFAYFLGLGEMLGFTWEQIEQGYLEKNRINHERQLNHY